MNDEDKKLQIATFRFGLISEFVTGVRLGYGEKEKLLKDKLARSYDIPFSLRSKLSRSSLEKWICDYKKAGYRLEGLYPQSRSDKGKPRSLSSSLRLAIKELKKESPDLKLPALITCLRHKKLIGADERINSSTLYRYLHSEELTKVNEDATDKRHFEAVHPNEIWQSDVMHGPYVRADGKSRKSYLIAIIDDHSRFIVHAEFYLNETRENFLDCLRLAILKRGLPQKLYIDNGSCFKALHLEQVTAQLGIGIKHSRPYIPQGRGKIERWFKYVRDNFVAVSNQTQNPDKLDLLNQHFGEWVDEYNNRVHGTTKETPYKRYLAGLECVRPAPNHLLDYFRQIEFRRVKKDRTVRLMGTLLEAPVGLIDRQVELRFHAEDLSQVEIFFQGKSYGIAPVVNPHVNSLIGRNWDPHPDSLKPTPEIITIETPHPTGQLFPNKTEGDV
ncbi:MAG: transposase [Deltaproteobacteria bacterium]|nr:transposase [Deltaproteobacteria bacterium]